MYSCFPNIILPLVDLAHLDFPFNNFDILIFPESFLDIELILTSLFHSDPCIRCQ